LPDRSTFSSLPTWGEASLTATIDAATEVVGTASGEDLEELAAWRTEATRRIIKGDKDHPLRSKARRWLGWAPETALAEFDQALSAALDAQLKIVPVRCAEVEEMADAAADAARITDLQVRAALRVWTLGMWRWQREFWRTPRKAERQPELRDLVNRLATACANGSARLLPKAPMRSTCFGGDKPLIEQWLDEAGVEHRHAHLGFPHGGGPLQCGLFFSFHGTNLSALEGMRRNGLLALLRDPSLEQVAQYLRDAGLILHRDGRKSFDPYCESAVEPRRVDWTAKPFAAWTHASVSPEWIQSIELRGSGDFLLSPTFQALREQFRTDEEVAILSARHVTTSMHGWVEWTRRPDNHALLPPERLGMLPVDVHYIRVRRCEGLAAPDRARPGEPATPEQF